MNGVTAVHSNVLDDNLSRATPWLKLQDCAFHSRLIIGIEQYTSAVLVGAVLDAAGSDVFITTLDLEQARPSLLLSDVADVLEIARFVRVGTTSFATSREVAVHTARLLRSSCRIEIVKLDVRPHDNLPDNVATIDAAAELLADGFEVLPFIIPDPESARRLQHLGCAAIRIMASPVGSAQGIADERAVRESIGAVTIPVIVEGGLALPSHAARAIELGADAVLVNTAIVKAANPAAMAAAMRRAVAAGIMARAAHTVSPPGV